MHDPQEPTIDKLGDEEHPAFGKISVHRVHSTPPTTLFDSEIQHGNYVRITVYLATRRRELHQDWIHETGRRLIEVDMSESQWAGLVSAFNTSGIPCTIRATETQHNVPGLYHQARLSLSTDEARDAAHRTYDKVREALTAVEEKPTKANLRVLRQAVEHAAPNVEFAAKSLTEHAENVVQKARADVEAMVVTHARALGLDATDISRIALNAPQEDQ
jgi:hypothetical protein